MIKYYDGTVFNANTQAIVNTVNCLGVMGTGLALEYKLRYPEMYSDYLLKSEKKMINIGNVDYYHLNDEKTIINFPTKHHFKYPSKIEWIEKGLIHFVSTYKAENITSVAFPKLGTSHGGLNWNVVKIIMETYLSPLDIDIYICLDIKKEAEGIEKEMIQRFNFDNIDNISRNIKLNKTQKLAIENTRPYARFYKILETESIGLTTYSKIFEYYYQSAISPRKTHDELKQMSLF